MIAKMAGEHLTYYYNRNGYAQQRVGMGDVSVQHPLPTDGDSVYAKDIWLEECEANNWEDANGTGDHICVIPFNDLHTKILNSSGDNPKTLLIHFNRTVAAHQVGLGCYQGSDSFSNVRIELLGSSGEVRNIINEETNDTKYNSRNYNFNLSLFNAIKIYFYTSDEVCISNITIQKARLVTARLEEVYVDETGGIRTFEPVRVLGTTFDGDMIDPNFWEIETSNGGSVTQNGQAIIETGGELNGTAELHSVKRARKVAGVLNQFRMIGRLSTEPEEDNIRNFGIFDEDDGAFFNIDGTNCNIILRKNGVDTIIPENDFNGRVDVLPKDTRVHRFVINYSAFTISFYCDDELIHQEKVLDNAWSSTLTLPIRIESKNINDNDNNNGIYLQLATILRLGTINSEPNSDFQQGEIEEKVLKYSAGEVNRLVISSINNNSDITLYDNTEASGTILWNSGELPSRALPITIEFGKLPFSKGLTLQISNEDSYVITIYE